ncbi:MAG: hypothetical protein KGJ57_22450 [Sphingomonadales bacterium]|nr:hypothetical protein [Sphingomonadales bacterium]MDE2172146.1 hypothetical protein [Sphingomonadales bacterium]
MPRSAGAGEEDGFFDALANGLVSATDPRSIGGDLVNYGAQPWPGIISLRQA